MLRTAKSRGPEQQAPKPWALIVFSVGGKRIAVRSEEVGGIWPWTESMPVPSRTPYVDAVLRRGEEVLPVFDLAKMLDVQVTGPAPLALIVKQKDGSMAVCIDSDIPTMHTVEVATIRSSSGVTDVLGMCSIGAEDVPIYSLATLGQSAAGKGQRVA